MDRSIARRLLAAALGLGLLAEVVLDGSAFGVNIVLLVAVTLLAAWLVRRQGRAPDPLDAWLPISALILAGFVAVRGDPFLAVLDTLGALAFLGASVAAMSGLPVTRRAASAIAGMAAWTLGAVVAGAPRVAGAARTGPVTAPGWASGLAARWWLPLIRGLLIGLPLALIFAVLFASADPIFRRGLDDLLGWQLDLGSLGGRAVFTLACAWLAAGLLMVAATGIPPFERASLGAAARTPLAIDAARLGTMEAIIVLAIVDLVVGLFVVLQIAYLFGGQSTLVAAGMTYSDYARRGFFELVAAACLAGGVVVALETTVERRSRPYLAALLALIGLTGGRARVRRAPAPPLPGCLRLDRAPAVRPDDDRGPRGDAGRHGDPGAWPGGCAGWGTAWRSSVSSRSSRSTSSRRRVSWRHGTWSASSTRASSRPAATPASTRRTSASSPMTRSRSSSRPCPPCPRPSASRSDGSSTSGGASSGRILR